MWYNHFFSGTSYWKINGPGNDFWTGPISCITAKTSERMIPDMKDRAATGHFFSVSSLLCLFLEYPLGFIQRAENSSLALQKRQKELSHNSKTWNTLCLNQCFILCCHCQHVCIWEGLWVDTSRCYINEWCSCVKELRLYLKQHLPAYFCPICSGIFHIVTCKLIAFVPLSDSRIQMIMISFQSNLKNFL